MKAWAWEWARRLSEDITLTAFWFTELSRLAGVPRNEKYTTALSWMVAAYYEYLKGRWDKARAEKQVKEALAISLGGGVT